MVRMSTPLLLKRSGGEITRLENAILAEEQVLTNLWKPRDAIGEGRNGDRPADCAV